MDNNFKQKFFSDKDRRLLEMTSKSTWTPPNPSELILPYLEKDAVEGETDLEKRLRKSQEVLDGYAEVIKKCDALCKELETKCKNVSVPIDPEKDIRVLEAARRVFKRDISEITFDMYREVIKKMAAENNSGVPTLGGK
jgi:hypothetical protein